MKKYINIFAALMVTLIGLSLTSCSDDDLKTGQYGSGVQLNVFGPSPVMRGGTLRFIGSNLDQVNQVLIPGVSPITNIEVVKSGIPSEIRITVPKDGPEPGYVTLVTKTDQSIKTITPLAFSEPIVIEGFEPASAMPGEEVTIKGDYLNLIHMIEFADGVYVSEKEFKTHDRYQITVVVPETAKTGKLGLYDLDISDSENASTDVSYNIIMTEEALNVGTPTISSLASARTSKVDANGTITVKSGEEITITGEDFNLVAAVVFGEGENTVKVENFKVSEDNKTITVNLPAEAPTGDIVLVCRSTVEIPVGKFETIKPTDLKAAPDPVKNGAELTITGKDLDIVKKVTFPNSEAIDVKAEEAKVVVAVPESAQEGDVTLTMANNETVTVKITLVKPTVTSYSSSPVSAGAALSINGTDLDLVKSVTFTEAEALEVSAEEKVINLTVPMEAKSGAVTLNLKNGATITAADIKVSAAEFCYAKALPTDEDEVRAGQTMTLEVANGDKLKEVKINGETCQIILQDTRLIIGVPLEATKSSKLELISSNGQIEYTVSIIPNTEKTTVIWTGLEQFTNWGSSVVAGKDFDWNSLTENSEIVVNLEKLNTGWGCLAVRDGNWKEISLTKGQYDLNDAGKTQINIELTADLKDHLAKNNGILFSGHDIVVSQVAILEHLPSEETLWEGNEDMGSYSNQPYLLDEKALANAKVGQTLRFYGSAYDADWKFEAFDGHWAQNKSPICGSWGPDSGVDPKKGIAVKITEDVLKLLYNPQNWGGVFVVQGKNFILTKITIE